MAYYDIEEARIHLKNLADDRLEKSKIKNKYTCPYCGSGTGHRGTAAFTIHDDTNMFHCYSCGEHGDIFKLIGKLEGIQDFKGRVERIHELFGLADCHLQPTESGNYVREDAHNYQCVKKAYNTISEEEKENNKEYIIRCHRDLMEEFKKYQQTGQSSNTALIYLQKHRGIDQEDTYERFFLGYDRATNRVVIPYNEYYYNSRTLNPQQTEYKFIKTKGSFQGLFNYNVFKQKTRHPIFILESELDAILLEQSGFRAVALGGIQNQRKLLKIIQENTMQSGLIILGDNDEPGRKFEQELKNELDQACVCNLSASKSVYMGENKGKDITELYLNNPEETLKRIREIEREAGKHSPVTKQNLSLKQENMVGSSTEALPSREDQRTEQILDIQQENSRRNNFKATLLKHLIYNRIKGNGISLEELVKKINKIIDPQMYEPMEARNIVCWLLNNKYLKEWLNEVGDLMEVATDKGTALGIETKLRYNKKTGTTCPDSYYSPRAQKFIIQNLSDILGESRRNRDSSTNDEVIII